VTLTEDMAERGAQSLPAMWPPARRVEVARDVLTTARVPELLAEVERLRGELAASQAVCEAARQLVVDAPDHDCRGPSCRLCGRLADALDDWRSTHGDLT